VLIFKVAFQNELQPHYKIHAKDHYHYLEQCLMSRDRTFVRALVLITPPTEYDLVISFLSFDDPYFSSSWHLLTNMSHCLDDIL
jgi:hypothetical protein